MKYDNFASAYYSSKAHLQTGATIKQQNGATTLHFTSSIIQKYMAPIAKRMNTRPIALFINVHTSSPVIDEVDESEF